MRKIKLFVLLFALAFSTKLLAQKDVEGSEDHPLLSRYSGSTITGYSTNRFVAYPIYDYDKSKWATLEGKFVSIIYRAPNGLALLEVHRNYEKALEDADFKKVYQCRSGCTLYSYVGKLNKANLKTPVGHYGNLYSDDGYYSWYEKDGMQIVLMTTNQKEKIYTSVDFIGDAEMEMGMVKADANAIGDALRKEGKISIYGITFATGSATIQAESKATLAEIAQFLKSNPTIKIYVVGHTDDTGSLATNLSLSESRAKAVVQSLTTEYGISASRLSSSGVGPYAPVASNLSESGKAKNRRVELVRRLK